MLKIQNLSKSYRTENVETTALNNIEIEIKKGEFIAIMGPSGCGKSTLLNTIGMLDSPTSGHYWFNDEDVANYSEAKLANIRKHNIGFIFQSFNLIDELSVRENIELALLYHNIPSAERKERVEKVMQQVGITHRANHMPSQLSGGQQQRVAVARAVVGDQTMILADEPTGNLDTQHGHEVMEMLQELNANGKTIVMVTHSPAHAEFATRTITLLDGQVVEPALKAVS
ncbi:phosphonate ABC transporter ATP-binding protein [Psychrosphaera saromensis]|jgi:putative ABC transport system ATP-binding protein|uniref:Phosphonate ABC transporter ATP-binding protein n=1 Tax=Psychrosphaera saromensis TaxID=716813 RepID=A0A2S7UWF0_9GAMM|nr:ABC transporter ATP-binding protein [Psychrosphaera saromensis]PQJ53601.1 phosphonate ABC transporter ATP-binding protein [Psychrosphaera saromensis]GHB63945.1 phosphonate ABC transporter ATP-binding protein [Psychrosphaera saromensis]GLQ15637.1 phosphonate ABC transporter ATP-binding protein [Psychrosphaera saromensis]